MCVGLFGIKRSSVCSCVVVRSLAARAQTLLTAQGVRKAIEIFGMEEAALQWVQAVLLPTMEGATVAAAAMEDEKKHAGDEPDQSMQPIERKLRRGAASRGGSVSGSHAFGALNHSAGARSAAAPSSSSAVAISFFPNAIHPSAASSSSSSSTFFGLIRDDRVRGAIRLDAVHARALEAEAAVRSGMPSRRAWSCEPFTYRGMLRKTAQGQLLRHGLGQSTYDNGSVFIGEYRDGKCNGQPHPHDSLPRAVQVSPGLT